MRKRLIACLAVAVLTLSSVCAQAQTGGNHPLFDKMDSGHKGYLTKQDVQARFPKFTDDMFKKADTNGDGKLTVEEWQAFGKAWRVDRKARAGAN